MSNADTLTAKLDAIGDAIRAKTGGASKLTLDEMPTAIAGISGGGKFPVARLSKLTTSPFSVFASQEEFESCMDLLDFTGSYTMRGFFRHVLVNVTTLDLSILAGARPTSLDQFAYQLRNQVTKVINTDALDTSAVTSVATCFSGMSELEELDISTWDLSSVSGMNAWGNLVNGCTSLKKLVLPATWQESSDNPSLFPVDMTDESGTAYTAGTAIPAGSHTYTATS